MLRVALSWHDRIMLFLLTQYRRSELARLASVQYALAIALALPAWNDSVRQPWLPAVDAPVAVACFVLACGILYGGVLSTMAWLAKELGHEC